MTVILLLFQNVAAGFGMGLLLNCSLRAVRN